MTHYNIDYTGLGPQLAYYQSIKDIKDYIGEEKFNHLTELFRKEYPNGLSLQVFALMVSFCGIQGFSVRAWHDHVFPFG